jgi:hypothetical protein
MTVGALKKLLESLDDDLPIIVVAPCEDEDGDDCETWFQVHEVASRMDADTGEEYAEFACTPLDDHSK